MHYFVDGYNCLFQLKKIQGSFQKKRERLTQILDKFSKLLHLHITIVFDATYRKKDNFRRGHYNLMEIVYTSQEQTADEYILECLSIQKKPANCCVVTADNQLRREATDRKVAVMYPKEFFTFLVKKQRKQLKNYSSKKLSLQDSPKEIERLLYIFEEKLKEDLL